MLGGVVLQQMGPLEGVVVVLLQRGGPPEVVVVVVPLQKGGLRRTAG